MLGRPCSLLYRDQPQTMEAAQRCMNEQRTVVQRTPLRKYDQVETTQWHELVYVCVEPDRLIIFSRESSGTEDLAAALQESEARYRSVVASLPDAVWSSTRATRCPREAGSAEAVHTREPG